MLAQLQFKGNSLAPKALLVKKDLKLMASAFIFKKLEKEEHIKTELCRKKGIIKVEINEMGEKETERQRNHHQYQE